MPYIIVYELLVLDKNAWNYSTVHKLFVVDRNTWYMTVCKQIIQNKF